MPDTFAVDTAGRIVASDRDRSRAFRRVFGYGPTLAVGLVYMGEPHDVQAPPRPCRKQALALERRNAYHASLTDCVNCGIDERGHDIIGDEYNGYEKMDDDACNDYTRPAPLVLT